MAGWVGEQAEDRELGLLPLVQGPSVMGWAPYLGYWGGSPPNWFPGRNVDEDEASMDRQGGDEMCL